jgi:AcrR family transcriptional regulator
VVQAAIRAFARKGYGGTTLADIAVEAGVSQPRISQIFGNKETAFLKAQQVASEEVLEVLASNAAPPFGMEKIGAGFRPMVAQRPEVLLLVFQMMTSAYVPSIAEQARHFVNEVVRIVTEQAGGTRADALELLSRGILFNAMLAVDAPSHAKNYPEMAQMLEEFDLLD